MARLEELSTYSESPDSLTRVYLSPEQRAAGRRLIDWMEEAGMTAGFDAVGNVVGRYEGTEPDLPALLTGSHYDTVRNAGKYDGTLGVVLPIACVKALHDAGERFPFAIEVIAFAEEEGVRFNVTLVGSRAIAGTLPRSVLEHRDAGGVSLSDALHAFGLDPTRIGDAAHDRDRVLGFVEFHIEQGPILEQENLPIGIVTSIAGAKRYRVTVTGQAGHAGTVPMNQRRDALAAAAEMVLAVERICHDGEGLVGTVGQMNVPGAATNVIPGTAVFTIDVRAARDAVRDAAMAAIIKALETVAARRGVEVDIEEAHEESAADCAPWLMSQLHEAIERAGIEPRYLMSGAGHDAMAVADLTDVLMLFVRCGGGGISHNPAETMTEADADIAAAILLDFFRHFRSQRR
jgi:allantoate deiminase